jgi:hypothetical protein
MILEIFDYFLLAPFRFGASRGNGGTRGKSRKEKSAWRASPSPRKGWNREECVNLRKTPFLENVWVRIEIFL